VKGRIIARAVLLASQSPVELPIGLLFNAAVLAKYLEFGVYVPIVNLGIILLFHWVKRRTSATKAVRHE